MCQNSKNQIQTKLKNLNYRKTQFWEQLLKVLVREQPIRKMQLKYGLLPKRSDPPLPQTFGTSGTLFRRLIFFVWNFWGTFFWSYFSKIRVKSAKKNSGFGPPPPLFCPKFQNGWCTKSVPKLLDCLGPFPPLMEEVHN